MLPCTFLVFALFTLAGALPHSTKRQSNQKYVVAHHIVGNTYPYTVTDWANDISMASAHGIDAFALNVGNLDWEVDRVADAYTAAENAGNGFKLFFSFDMSSLPCTAPEHASYLVGNVTQYAAHPSQFKYDNLVFVSTFAGESCQFGQGSVVEGWQTQFIDKLTGTNAVYFMPSFMIDPATFTTYNGVMNGAFNWNSGWPISLTTDVANQQLSAAGTSLDNLNAAGEDILKSFIGSTDTDNTYLNGLSAMSQSTSRGYMAAVSPWFFTHYGPDTYNKNWIYPADWHLYPRRWQNLVSLRDKVDIVEIVTWNDYGESHYIGPIEGAQPNSQAWVDGFDHQGWLDMSPYFITGFKTGSYPAITQDKIYLWARPHPRTATASADPVGPPTSYQVDQDQLWAVVMTTAASNVTLSTSSSNSQSFNVGAGVSLLNMPLTPGGSMSGVIARGGQNVASLSPSGYTFDPNPTVYNYNAFVAYTP
ncbi:glycoside hydrolase family 71 protein [Heliocybe sulcata]|uniref:Glycoside hydrolase family 71 protein n=1 Tax=Heliocybe sulcata TaxID=5364 RepID=A0A5C3MLK6_9AGAM|nr:glycoside hydrolase family 71 protein [Heliocybe sulcata]